MQKSANKYLVDDTIREISNYLVDLMCMSMILFLDFVSSKSIVTGSKFGASLSDCILLFELILLLFLQLSQILQW